MRREKGIKNPVVNPPPPLQNISSNPKPGLFRPSSPIREENYPQVESVDDRPIISKKDDKKKNLFSPRNHSPPIMKGKSRGQHIQRELESEPEPQPNSPSSPIHDNQIEYKSPPTRKYKPKKITLGAKNENLQVEKTVPTPININIENHPVIQHLREETALAIQEATQARKGNIIIHIKILFNF